MTSGDYIAWNSGDFVKAMSEFNQSKGTSTGKNLQGTSTNDLMLDYDYWIRVMVRWLFLKYIDSKQGSWNDAIKAYNGSGKTATNYRNQVLTRIAHTP